MTDSAKSDAPLVIQPQHTPGPWKVERAPLTRQICIMSADTWICGQIQSDNHTRIDTGECVANARLIAAAPDLLNALKSAMATLLTADDDKIPRLRERIHLAESAIAKAEGRDFHSSNVSPDHQR